MRLPAGNWTARQDRKNDREATFQKRKLLASEWNTHWEERSHKHALDEYSDLYRDLLLLFEQTGEIGFSQAMHALLVHNLLLPDWRTRLTLGSQQLAAEAMDKCLLHRGDKSTEAAEMVVHEINPFPTSDTFASAVKRVKNAHLSWSNSSQPRSMSSVWFVIPSKNAPLTNPLRDAFSGLTLEPGGMLVRADGFWKWAADGGLVTIDPVPPKISPNSSPPARRVTR